MARSAPPRSTTNSAGPCLGGYFRTYEHEAPKPALRRGYDKPIMLAGGIANLRSSMWKSAHVQPGDAVIVLGGPAMLIGLGGGAASSVASGGDQFAELDFASVQRDNAEMERRCQEVIDALLGAGADNPIVSIHDVGAGGLSNAIPEIAQRCRRRRRIDLRKIPSRRSATFADADLVQRSRRSAMCSAIAQTTWPHSRRFARASVARMRWSATPPRSACCCWPIRCSAS